MIASPTAETGNASLPVSETVMEAGKSELHYWRDLWRYRELFYFLAWRDILVRYKQTAIGIAWALIQPLVTTVVYTVLFRYLAKMPTEGNAPYLIMVLAAQLPWQFFARAMSEASISLIYNSNLISKVYFPRLIVPATSITTALVDFLISGALLAASMLFFRFMPGWRILLVPLFLLIAMGAAMGAGIWLAALNVTYRDFRFIVPFALQIGAYVSPVGFSSTIVPEKWRLLYSMNPMVGVIDGFRWAILGGDTQLYLPGFLLSILIVTVMLYSGIAYFRATERRFADVI